MNVNTPADLLTKLAEPFHPSRVTFKPGAVKGERALALAYADLRVYMDRLDEVCGLDWQVSYQPWGADRIICQLTIADMTRSSIGESTNEAERGEIGGTVAEAQAFKRACAMFGLGRYLYNLPTTWADFDPSTKQFTAQAKAKLTGSLVQHYRRATEGAQQPQAVTQGEITQPAAAAPRVAPPEPPGVDGDALFETPAQPADPETRERQALNRKLHAIGTALYGANWEKARHKAVEKLTHGEKHTSAELTIDELVLLVGGFEDQQRDKAKQPAANGVAA